MDLGVSFVRLFSVRDKISGSAISLNVTSCRLFIPCGSWSLSARENEIIISVRFTTGWSHLGQFTEADVNLLQC